MEGLKAYYHLCEQVSQSLAGAEKTLFDATLFLQVKIHAFCAEGVVLFGEAYDAYADRDYKKAFVLFGKSAEAFDSADVAMRAMSGTMPGTMSTAMPKKIRMFISYWLQIII